MFKMQLVTSCTSVSDALANDMHSMFSTVDCGVDISTSSAALYEGTVILTAHIQGSISGAESLTHANHTV